MLTMLAAFLLALPSLSLGQEQIVTPPEEKVANPTTMIPTLPPSNKCSSSSPCRNIMGEVQRIEESYWIKLPDGNELRVKASTETKMQDLPKVGDKVVAQVTSTGEAEAIVKVPDIPKPTELQIPPKSFNDLRGK
jgi:hypothetical protein